jgi:hypothetical protein
VGHKKNEKVRTVNFPDISLLSGLPDSGRHLTTTMVSKNS